MEIVRCERCGQYTWSPCNCKRFYVGIQDYDIDEPVAIYASEPQEAATRRAEQYDCGDYTLFKWWDNYCRSRRFSESRFWHTHTVVHRVWRDSAGIFSEKKMTPTDFRCILNERLLRYLPALSDYCRKLPAETKTAWAEQFASIEPTDLVEACRQIVSGREVLAAYDYGNLSIILLRIARGHATRRYEAEESTRNKQLAREYRGATNSPLMERAGIADEYKRILGQIAEEFPQPTLANCAERMARAKELGREARERI